MAQLEITSFFTRGGVPAVDIDNLNPHVDGKNYPRIRIWEISGNTYNLVVGDTVGSGQNIDGIMTPVFDTGVEDGFYSFVFTDVIGYDETKRYLVRSDGGPSLPSNERFQVVNVDPLQATVNYNSVADAVWDAQVTNHLDPGTTGAALAQIKADTTAIAQNLYLDADSVLELVNLLLKYETNRTKIDPVTKTLIVYDDNCTTPLRTFALFDHNGQPSVDEVCERRPVSATDGQPVCP